MGVNEDGRRELLGLKVGDSETETFWAEFISCLKERGLGGAKLVISDAHTGLTKAIRRQLQGSVWQPAVVTARKQAMPSESTLLPGARWRLAHSAMASELKPLTAVILA